MALRESNRKAHYTGRHMSHSIKSDQLISDENRSASVGYSFRTSGKSFERFLTLPKAAKYDIGLFSYTSADFAKLAKEHPEFEEIFYILSEIKILISNFNEKFKTFENEKENKKEKEKEKENVNFKWISICLDRSNNIPKVHLEFHINVNELFEEAEKTIDAIINK